MKNICYLLFSTMVLSIGLTSCTPSESSIQTAIAGTQAIESGIKQQTAVAVQAAAQTQEAFLAATETAKALSVSQTQTAIPRICTPGGTYIDAVGDVDKDYLDILKVDTVLEKGLLTVTFYVKSLPDKITVNQEGMEKGYGEYFWGVDIDVDNDNKTGVTGFGNYEISGIEYAIALFHFVSGSQKTGPIEKLISADLWKCDNKGCSAINKATLSIDYGKNTITLSAKVPGINEKSILYFTTNQMGPSNIQSIDQLCD